MLKKKQVTKGKFPLIGCSHLESGFEKFEGHLEIVTMHLGHISNNPYNVEKSQTLVLESSST